MKSRQLTKLLICLGLLLCAFLIKIYSDSIWKDDSANEDAHELITIWTIHGDTELALKKVLAKYKEDNPKITFEVTVYKNEVYQAAINNALMTDNLPDMFFWWGFSKLERLVDAEVVYDISLALDKKKFSSEVIEGGMKAFTFKERAYAMPLYGWAAALFCNQKIFKDNGIEIPRTYDQFSASLSKLQENEVIPMLTSVKEGWVSSLYYMSLVQGEGTGENILQAVNYKSLFSSLQFKEAAYKLYDLVEKKIWQDNYLESDAYNVAYSFAQGEAAMLYYGSWATTLIEGETSKVSNDVVVVPFPNGNNTEGIGGIVDTFVLNRQGNIPKNPDFINMYIDIMKEVSDIIVNDIGGGIPVYRDQSIDPKRFPLLLELWEINKNKTLYPAYDQIMSAELSAQYYFLLIEMMAGEINHEEFIEGLTNQ